MESRARLKLHEIHDNLDVLKTGKLLGTTCHFRYKNIRITLSRYVDFGGKTVYYTWIVFGVHSINLCHDHFRYHKKFTCKKSGRYDETRIDHTIFLPDEIFNFKSIGEEAYFQLSTLCNFEYLTYKDLNAIVTIQNTLINLAKEKHENF